MSYPMWRVLSFGSDPLLNTNWNHWYRCYLSYASRVTPVSLAALLLTLVCLPIRGQSSGTSTVLYSAADLGNGTVGTAINDSGTVVGSAYDSNGVGYPFTYSQGSLTNVTVAGIQGASLASGINNQGVIVGSGFVNPNTTAQPYVSFIGTDGAFQIVSSPGGTTGVSGINNNGVAAGGFALNYSNFYFDSFIYSGGTFADLGACETSWVNYAMAINDAGTVVGYCSDPGENHGANAFSFSNGTFTLLGYLPGGTQSDSLAINNAGTIAGWSTIATGATHAFSYSNGMMTDLGTLPGLTDSEANGISDIGEIVGYASDTSGLSLAFVDVNATMVDLNTVLLQPIGTTLTNAVAVNNNGQVVALGSNGHTYLLSPTSVTPIVTFTGAPASAPEYSTFMVVATTNSGATPTITASSHCSISGSTVTITAPSGICMLTATWPAQGSYLAASLNQSTAAEPPIPTIAWPTPAAITYGPPLSNSQLNATASYNDAKVPGTFNYTPAKGAVLAAGTQTLSVLFTPTNTTAFSPVTASVSLQVNQAVPKITWNKPAAIVYGTQLSSIQLDATASVAGSFLYSPGAGVVLTAGVQTLSVTFTPADSIDYTQQTATVNITVSKATPPITWTSPAPISYGTALGPTQLDATSAIPGTFTYSPAPGAVLAAGTQTLNATFTPTDTTDYTTAKTSVSIQVTGSTPTITWPTPAAITYGTPLSATQLHASAAFNGATVPGTYTYSPAKGTVLPAGMQTLTVVFTPSNTSNYSSVTSSVALQVNPATPKLTWSKPAAITYGTPLGGAQLDATASVPGSFLYSPGIGTILTAGSQILSVTFTPTDATDFQSVSGTVTITVSKATPTVSMAPSPLSISTLQSLSVIVTVSAGSGGATPTGSVLLTSGSYSSGAATLNGGSATITIPAGSLKLGNDTLRVTYSPDMTSSSYNSAIGTALVTVTQAPVTATPTFSPPGGAYSVGQMVSLSDTTPNATVWYTTDGSTPVAGQGTAVEFTGVPVPVNVNTTIKAVATASGSTTSSVASATYSFETAIMPATGLIGFWTGNHTAADSSPTANNGSFAGNYVPGRPGSGAAFDLSTGTVTIPNNQVYDLFVSYPGWTVGFWFNTNGIAPNGGNDFFMGQDDGSGYQPKWFIDYGYTVYGPNQDFVWHVNDYNTERLFLTSNAVNPIPAGWNQLTVVVDNTGSSVTFYLNGQQIGSDSLPPYVLETDAPLVFGEVEGLTFTGLMNDVTIYNRALSAQEVLTLVDSTR